MFCLIRHVRKLGEPKRLWFVIAIIVKCPPNEAGAKLELLRRLI